MATLTSAASGDYLSASSWSPAQVPTIADAVTVAAAHTVRLNGICAALSLTVTGKLTNDPAANTQLTTQTVLTVSTTTGQVELDVSADPTKTCELVLNGGGATKVGFDGRNKSLKISLKGYPRKRWARLLAPVAIGAQSAEIDDVTGWQIGDVIVFGSTTAANPTGATEEKTVSGISLGVVSWSGGTTYGYQTGGYVGNLTSNMIVRSALGTQAGATQFQIWPYQESTAYEKRLSHVQFRNLGHTTLAGGVYIESGNQQSDSMREISDCVLWGSWGLGMQLIAGLSTLPIERNLFYTKNQHTTLSYNAHMYLDGSWKESQIAGNLFITNPYQSLNLAANLGHVELIDNVFNGVKCVNAGTSYPFGIQSGTVLACAPGSWVALGQNIGCEINQRFGYANAPVVDIRKMANVTLRGHLMSDADFLSAWWPGSLSVIGAPDAALVIVIDRNADPLRQEVWSNQSSSVPTWSRDNATAYRSTSSIKISPRKLGKDYPWSQKIACPAGASITVVGYVRASSAHYNGGAWTPPKVRISGLGITPVEFVASAAANNAWEKYTLTAINTSGVDGEFDLDYHAVALAVTTGDVWFSGVPDAPFVNKCRHYGYRLADESSPTRSVDVYVEASEATAAAYTGITIDGQAEVITFGAGTGDSAQKFYDYTRWWACEELDYEVPLTRAGSLYSLSDGWVVIEPTYTGLIWGGGDVAFSAPGAKTINADGSALRFTVAGTYSFSGSLVDVDLVNTSGGAVTVQVPAGATVTNTGPNITVEQAQATLTIEANFSLVGAEVRIYDLNSAQSGSYGDELSGIESCPTATYAYAGAAGNLVMIQVMKTGYVEYVQAVTLPATSQTLQITLQPYED